MTRPLRILIVGATGLLGQALSRRLTSRGNQVFAFSRRPIFRENDTVTWLHWTGMEPPSNIPEQLDAVINLAGENIAAGRWTERRKNLLTSSRVDTTRFLVEALRGLSSRPPLLLSASATGYYGDRAREFLNENSPSGTGFLAELCTRWEREALAANDLGIRVTLLRFGVVLTTTGGALKKMLLPFQLGLGGKIGSGEQFMSWIALEDLLSAIEFLLHNSLQGAVNVVAPEACQNQLFTQALAAALHRPAYLPIPGCLLKLAFGQMAQEVFLYSTRAYPTRLLEAGFTFRLPEISTACREIMQTELRD